MSLRNLRLLIIAVACLVGGVVLILHPFAVVPALDELTKVTGEVTVVMETRRTRYTSPQYPVLTVRGSSGRYKYLDWFPRAEEIPAMLNPGDRVTLWTDAGKLDWVWQIERDGQIIIPYQDVRDAVAANWLFYPILGVVVLSIGVGAAYFLYRSYATPPAPPR